MPFGRLRVALAAALLFDLATAYNDLLRQFKTRPDIQAPNFDITIHEKNLTSLGYWLYAPYYSNRSDSDSRPRLSPGPYIFDHEGELVWSGSTLKNWKHINDFRYTEFGEFSMLSEGNLKSNIPGGAIPVVLNSSPQLSRQIVLPTTNFTVDPHVFQFGNNGSTALLKTTTPDQEAAYEGQGLLDERFYEIDRFSGQILFEWRCLDHVSVSESAILHIPEFRKYPIINFFHMDSLEKTRGGDYLISARHTNTIYLISGRNGTILWRFGGQNSSFKLDGFNFSAQHDARILHSEDPNQTLISFVNNASNQYENTTLSSSGLIVSLNHKTRVASVVLRLNRPDGGLTTRRGNVQKLTNGNYFVCWSEFGYVSEHDSSGHLIMEARLRDEGLASYRAFKLVSSPPWSVPSSEQPVLKGFVQTQNGNMVRSTSPSIAAFVSWNGATTISSWRLYGCIARWPRLPLYQTKVSPWKCESESTLLAEANKQGFETKITTNIDMEVHSLYAEAVDSSGRVLGSTAVTNVEENEIEATFQDPQREKY